jgi:transcription elongation factor Elf1
MDKPVLECPRCRQEWRITEDGKAFCSSCGHESELQFFECPNCSKTALVGQVGAGKDSDYSFHCYSCGSRWSDNELERCPECYQWKPSGEFEELIICRSSVGFYVCRACYEKIFK